MTTEELLRGWHALTQEWRNHVAQVEIDLYGTVPDAVFDAHVRLRAKELNPDLYERLNHVSVELDIAKMELEERMVAAHEWLRNLREGAEHS